MAVRWGNEMKIEHLDLCPCCFPKLAAIVVTRLKRKQKVYCPGCRREIVEHKGKLYMEFEAPKKEVR